MKKIACYSMIAVLCLGAAIAVFSTAKRPRSLALIPEQKLVGHARDVSVSDDAQHIVFSRWSSFYYVDLSKKNSPKHIADVLGGSLSACRWLPGGRLFCYSQDAGPGHYQTWVYDTKTSGKTLIAEYTPAYISPDYKKVYCAVPGKSPWHVITDVATGKVVAKEPARWIKVSTGGQYIGKTGMKNPLIIAAQNWKPLINTNHGLSPDGKYLVYSTRCSCGIDGNKGPGEGKCSKWGVPGQKWCRAWGMPNRKSYVLFTRDAAKEKPWKETLIGRTGASVLWYKDSKRFLILQEHKDSNLSLMDTNLKRIPIKLPANTSFINPIKLIGKDESRLVYMTIPPSGKPDLADVYIGKIK